MKLKKGFVLRDVCGEKVIMGEGIGALDFGRLLCRLLCLNETAAWLWEKAESLGEFTVEALAEALYSEYEVDLERAKADVSAIVGEWQKVKVVE